MVMQMGAAPTKTVADLTAGTLGTSREKESLRHDLANAALILTKEPVRPFEGAILPIMGKQAKSPAPDVAAPSAELRADGSLVVTVPGPADDPEKYAREYDKKKNGVAFVTVGRDGRINEVWAIRREGDKIIFPPPANGTSYHSGNVVFCRHTLTGAKYNHIPVP